LRLAIITLGHVHTEDLVALTPHFEHIEQLVLDIPPRDELSQHRAELNRAVDAASTDWILVVREREVVDEALAKEILKAASDVQARGFRIRSVPFYAGKALHLGKASGEVRLFHRRYYMRFANKGQWDELMIQGSVVRLTSALHSMTFATVDEHRAHLAERATRRGGVGRVLQFLRYWLGTRTFDGNTLRYLWVEASFQPPM
jgi:transcriptional regulator of nitric oxide reductase